MATCNFDLLDLADGESGDAAVSVVVGKKKAAAAKLAAAKPAAATQEKTKHFSYFTKLQHDSGVRICQQDLKKLSDALGKLTGEETKLREQPGNEARLGLLWDEQRRLRQEQMKLKEKEATLVQQRDDFYYAYSIPLPHGANADLGRYYNDGSSSDYSDYSSSGYTDYGDYGSSGYSDYGGNNDQYQAHVCDGGEHYPHGHDERQIGRGHDPYDNGDRHLGEIEPTNVEGHIVDHSVADAGIQDWLGSSGYSDYGGNNDRYQTHVCDGGEQYPQRHDEGRIGRGDEHYNNGDRHLGEIERINVERCVVDHPLADAGTQDWVHIDISGLNSVTDAEIQDWEYIDIGGPNNHTNGAL